MLARTKPAPLQRAIPDEARVFYKYLGPVKYSWNGSALTAVQEDGTTRVWSKHSMGFWSYARPSTSNAKGLPQ